ncbi:hypothetical protein SAMD00019534_119290 [Acytostelium subglobosum LB1]|uniref:hypothetical protein n=1 Tax=Acytostelium subglobosum LB1 TaxID=1410327 RepID=UPI000644872C|nr:hypothetical protein SAMD00019534_119290 [Acytostelium subglobosum LB1]GAM28753.1 hypothetical protein SAMD00019534_119290 [Acytostelium subglobosum LB1]|eukprot:XP_012748308.1 hypothetical protein SAMD00019534_119290 [Acytostelium subglobosum LB1]
MTVDELKSPKSEVICSLYHGKESRLIHEYYLHSFSEQLKEIQNNNIITVEGQEFKITLNSSIDLAAMVLVAGLYSVYLCPTYCCVYCLVTKESLSVFDPTIDFESRNMEDAVELTKEFDVSIAQRKYQRDRAKINGGQINAPLIPSVGYTRQIPDNLHLIPANIKLFARRLLKEVDNCESMHLTEAIMGVLVNDLKIFLNKVPHYLDESPSSPLMNLFQGARPTYTQCLRLLFERERLFNMINECLNLGEPAAVSGEDHDELSQLLDDIGQYLDEQDDMFESDNDEDEEIDLVPDAQLNQPITRERLIEIRTLWDQLWTLVNMLLNHKIHIQSSDQFRVLGCKLGNTFVGMYGATCVTTYLHTLSHHIGQFMVDFACLDRHNNCGLEGCHSINKDIVYCASNGNRHSGPGSLPSQILLNQHALSHCDTNDPMVNLSQRIHESTTDTNRPSFLKHIIYPPTIPDYLDSRYNVRMEIVSELAPNNTLRRGSGIGGGDDFFQNQAVGSSINNNNNRSNTSNYNMSMFDSLPLPCTIAHTPGPSTSGLSTSNDIGGGRNDRNNSISKQSFKMVHGEGNGNLISCFRLDNLEKDIFLGRSRYDKPVDQLKIGQTVTVRCPQPMFIGAYFAAIVINHRRQKGASPNTETTTQYWVSYIVVKEMIMTG